MRKFVCLLALICSFSFASPSSEGLSGFMHKLASSEGTFLPLSFSFNKDDVNLGLWGGKKIANGLYVYGQSFNFHVVNDTKDTVTRIGAVFLLHTIAIPISIYEFFDPSSHELNAYYVMALLLNPMLEFYVLREYVPISVGIGYNTDWFAFKPNRKFYFRAHGDVNVDFPFVRLTASYSYSFLDTYNLKKGFRFYFGVALFHFPTDSKFF
jgi:hypothetical protein